MPTIPKTTQKRRGCGKRCTISFLQDPWLEELYTSMPVAPVAYQVILEPGIGQFREFESPRGHSHSYKFVGTFS